ncbi:MAG TPA: hypothetical protein VFQ41_11135 [Candidatus Angelobacter sp.]|nr:hypothetical protein [Candidatus Angelobacter sp.]
MNSAKPPRLAEWLLQEFGPDLNHEALTGDLNEAFQQGRSSGWYWRQVLAAVRWRRLLRALLFSAFMAWLMSSPFNGPALTFVRRPVGLAVFTAVYFASLLAPGIKRRRLRVLLSSLIAAVFGLLCLYKPNLLDYWSFLCLAAWNVVLKRKALGPASTLRQLAYGNPDAERQRLMEKLHLAMLQETDPEKRQAYAESIAALKRNASPPVKAMQ